MAKLALCQFLPNSHRENLPADAVVYDVSSYADFPYCTLSPMWVHGNIPVPGMSGKVSDTVEGIWQGLKVIRDKPAFHLFKGKGKKRGGNPPAICSAKRPWDIKKPVPKSMFRPMNGCWRIVWTSRLSNNFCPQHVTE